MHAPGTTLRRLAAASVLAALSAACGSVDPAPVVPPPCTVPASVTLGATEALRLVGPTDWPAGCATLTVRAPALGATERLGLVLVNAGGADNATPSILASGTAAFADAGPGPVAAVAPSPAALTAPSPRDLLEEGKALAVERRRAGMASWLAGQSQRRDAAGAGRTLAAAAACTTPPTPPAIGSKRSFCKDKLTGIGRIAVQRDATLVQASDHALFYVADEVLTQVQALLTQRPTMWQDFADYFEGTNTGGHNADLAKRILPALHQSFGDETDYDGNCRLVFFFANLIEYLPSSPGVIVGYFDPTDQQAADPFCGSAGVAAAVTGSNGADMLFLLDPATFLSRGFSLTTVFDEVPSTMAHELQHDVIFNTRCRAASLASCGLIDDAAGDLWLNEGLSMISEDFAGFGLHTPIERRRVGTYLGGRSGSNLSYQDVSLTLWPAREPGNPTGHYGGAHAFIRWLADQADATPARTASASGSSLTRALVASPSASKAAVAAAYGQPFEEVFARFGAGALFSGEDALFATYPGPLRPSPDLAYASGVAWSPLHSAVSRVIYNRLQPGAALLTTLKADGWGSYLSGRGTGAEATLTITSTATVKPRAAVVRLNGDLALP